VRPVPSDLFPFESRRYDRGDGIHMAYLDEGSGPPVVMVHGNPTWSFFWRSLVARLAPEHRCIVPDHVGMGRSDMPDDVVYRYTLSSRVDDLERLLNHLDLSDVTLVVHDWGGMIGLGWAVRHPSRVGRLVVLNTAAFHLPAGKKVPWQLALVRDTQLGALVVRGLNGFARGAARAAVGRSLDRRTRDAYCAPYDSWRTRRATLRFVQDIPLTPVDPAYAEVSRVDAALGVFADRPILVCWGERDFVFDLDYLAEFERRWPHAEVHRFPEAGHYVLEDAGAEVVDLVASFLERHTPTEAEA
jgi:haloalkane dehalogenase